MRSDIGRSLAEISLQQARIRERPGVSPTTNATRVATVDLCPVLKRSSGTADDCSERDRLASGVLLLGHERQARRRTCCSG